MGSKSSSPSLSPGRTTYLPCILHLQRIEEENFGNSFLGRLRSRLWNLTEYPESGRDAQVNNFVMHPAAGSKIDCLSGLAWGGRGSQIRESSLILEEQSTSQMVGCMFILDTTLSMVHKGQRIFVCMYVGN